MAHILWANSTQMYLMAVLHLMLQYITMALQNHIFSDQFLKLDGSNANSDIDITPYNLTVNNISAFNLKSPASYIIWTDGSTIYALNGSTGKIDYSGTDAATVIQNAVDNGSVISFTDATFVISDTITVPANKIIYLNKATIDFTPTNKHCIEIQGRNTYIFGGKIQLPSGFSSAGIYLNGTNIIASSPVMPIEIAYTNILGQDTSAGKGIWVDSETSGAITWLKVHNIFVYSLETGLLLRQQGTGYVNGNTLYGNTLYWCKYPIRFLATNSDNLKLNTIRDCQIQTKTSVTTRVLLATGGSYNTIECEIWDWHVAVSSDAVELYPITEWNYLDLNFHGVTATYIDNGTDNKIIRRDIKTSNSGTAIFSGDGTNTSFTISHGLATTPSQVLITPTNSSMASATWWVSAKSSTTFTITFSTAPSNGDKLSFDWYAEV